MTIEEQILGRDKLIGAEAIWFYQAVISHFDLSDMDAKCLLALYHIGVMSPGSLAKELLVTPGAITPVIDRLEKAGYVRRVNDRSDRRKMRIEPRLDKLELIKLQYKPVIMAARRILKAYTPEELAVLARFSGELDEILRREVEALRTQDRQ